MGKLDSHEKAIVEQERETGPWDASLAKLREWDPAWAEVCFKMSTNPRTNGALPRKFIELVSVGLNAACTNLNSDGTRRHVRAALDAGASRNEILFVLKCASVFGDSFLQLGRSHCSGGS